MAPTPICIIFLAAVCWPAAGQPQPDSALSTDLRPLLFNPEHSDEIFIDNLAVVAKGAALQAPIEAADALYLTRRLFTALPNHTDAVLRLLRFLIDHVPDVTRFTVGMAAVLWSDLLHAPTSSTYVPLLCLVLDVAVPHHHVPVFDFPASLLATLAEFTAADQPSNRVCDLLPGPVMAVFPNLAEASHAIAVRHCDLLRRDPILLQTLYWCGLPIDLSALPVASMTGAELRAVSAFTLISAENLISVMTSLISADRPDLVAELVDVLSVRFTLQDWKPHELFELCCDVIRSPDAIQRLLELKLVRDAVRTETTATDACLLHVAAHWGCLGAARVLLATPVGLKMLDCQDWDGKKPADYAATVYMSELMQEAAAQRSSSS